MNKRLGGWDNSKKVVFLSFVLLLLLFARLANAQFYETGQDPFSISWKQIKTKNYRLIFPSGFEKSARLFAAAMDTFYPVSSKYLIKKPKPISIVLHTQSSLSNGLVVYAPKRMELYTIPPQDNYPQDWLDQLALHETRHVVQLDALDQGITKVGTFLLGQQAVGGISGMVPRWFLEGDAVYSETVFSSSGRGRTAAFLMPYRTLTLDNRKYSYEKALLGSYKDFVPDVYQMGYPMVKMMRDSFDREIFGRSLRFTARNPFLIFPFGHALTHTSGLNNRHSYEFTYATLKNQWESQDNYKTYSRWPVRETRTFTNYNLPVALNDSLLLVQKYSLAETRRYSVVNHDGKEKKLIAVGSNSGEKISVYKNKFTWSENKTDLRWTNRTYSEVMVFDMTTKRQRRLTKRTWYFSPVFSPDGNRIATIEETPAYECYLVIVDAVSGKVLSKTEAPPGNHLQNPQWPTGDNVYCLSVGKSGKSLVKINIRDGGPWETVVPASFKNISNFCIVNNHIVIAGENDGINDLFLYHPDSSTYYQITNTRFGAFEPSIDTVNRKLYFAEYTPNGYRVAFLPWNPDTLLPVPGYSQNTILPDTHPFSGFNIQATQRDSVTYPSGKFSRVPHLINVHSWIPAYYNYSVSDIANPTVYPGFIFLSQDLLGTLVSTFGYSFEEGRSHLHATLNYKAL
ncbi:MAG TPA: hypothetical protein VHO90_19345, partial [Bacteroidales bacterium]|nr:hypothetical protein [Bacteroidales bacterium]